MQSWISTNMALPDGVEAQLDKSSEKPETREPRSGGMFIAP